MGLKMKIRLPKGYPYLYETHLHTSQGSACAVDTGKRMAEACKAAGYTGIIVTDHNWGGNTAVNRYLPWINHHTPFSFPFPLSKTVNSPRFAPHSCLFSYYTKKCLRYFMKNLRFFQCHLVNGSGRREEHKMLRHHAFAR